MRFLLYLLMLSMLVPQSLWADTPYDILVIHSYDSGLSWTSDIQSGISSVLNGRKYRLFTEYMDSKRFDFSNREKAFVSLLQSKYENSLPDVIIVADNSALEFIERQRRVLFRDVPVVFCGINNFSYAMVRGDDLLTGVNEDIDVEGTIHHLLELFPETKTLLVINDITPTGIKNMSRFEEVRLKMSLDSRLNVDVFQKGTYNEMIEKVKNAKEGTVLLLFSFHRDSTGETFSLDEYSSAVVKASNVPVFTFWEHMMGGGILGGVLVSGEKQGARAALMAKKILDGTPPSLIPVDTRSPNRKTVDYTVAKRFEVLHRVDEITYIYNEPPALASKYHDLVVITLAIGLVLLGSIVAFSMVLLMRRRSMRELYSSEEKFRTLFKNANDAIFLTIPSGDDPGTIIEVNDVAVAMFGYRREELLGSPVRMLRSDKAPANERVLPELYNYGNATFQDLMRTRSGIEFSVEISSSIIEFQSRRLSISVMRDITEQSIYEKKLQQSNELLHAIRNINQYITRLRDKESLAGKVCNELVGIETFSGSWLLLLDEKRNVESYFSTGSEGRFDEFLKDISSSGSYSRCPGLQQALVRKDPVRINPRKRDCAECPLLSDEQLHDMVFMQISYENNLYGVMAVTVDRGYSIDNQKLALLGEVADDIAFAFSSFAQREKRLMAEKKLHDEKEKLQFIIDSTGTGLWNWNVTDGSIDINESYYALFGYDEDEPLDVNIDFWRETVHPDDLPAAEEALLATLSGQTELYEAEFRMRHNDGHWLWIIGRGRVVARSQDGAPLRMVGVHIDTSGVKNYEHQLEMSREWYRKLFTTSPTGLVVYDENLVIYDANERFAEMLGSTVEKLIGLDMNTLKDKRVLPAVIDALDGREGRYEGPYAATTSETSLFISLKTVPLDISEKWGRGGFVHLEDITERVQTDEQIRKNLNEKEVLLQEIHHRVKNNLNIITSLLSLQSMELEEREDMIMAFDETVTRIHSIALIHELLYRSEDFSSVDFRRYIENLLRELKNLYDSDGSIATRIDMEEVFLPMDTAIPCGLIINEILTNAYKHAFAGLNDGEISLSMRQEGSIYFMTIADNGKGIDDTAVMASGTSLGMQLMHILTEQLHGDIQFSNDGGTTVTLSFSCEI